jgi:hypothetical protein
MVAAPLPAVPHTADPAPAPPAWAVALMGQPLRQAFPSNGVCRGNIDNLIKVFEGQPPGMAIVGWGFDLGARARIDRVVLADLDGRIAGAGEGGLRRLDVPRAVPSIRAMDTGWRAVTPRLRGPLDAFGITADGKSICPLGHIEF